jgi:iron complex outermembrane receptor protein
MKKLGQTARIGLLATAAGACLALSGPAWAQDTAETAQAAAPAPDTSTQESTGERIVVTAQKRQQVLIDVPQSITVISGATLEKQQATNFQDYLKLVPGLQLDQSNPGEGRLILRGLNTGGVASAVAVYLDETPFGSSSGLVNGGVLAGDFDTFDVNRVEVLRGPQGTLYGASSLGGLLKFVTNEPDTSRVIARGRVALEDTKGGEMSYRGHAVVNVPLSDTIAVRASGTYRSEGGFIDSVGTSDSDAFGNLLTSDIAKDINGSKSYGGRASILFKPSDVFSVRLSANLQNIRTESPSFVEADPDTLKQLHGGLTQSRFVKPFGNLDYRVYNGLVDYDLGFATITSSTSFSEQNQTRRQDLTFNLHGVINLYLGLFGFAPVDSEVVLDQHTDHKKFTQEVRLASHESDKFEWLVGGYYTKEEGLIFQEFIGFEPGTGIHATYPAAFDPLAKVNLDSDYEEIAGFANATVHLGDRFHVDFGGRYSHNKQSATQSGEGILAGGTTLIDGLNSSDDVFTYSVAPRFEINDHASIYGRIAKGYRPGGPNVTPPLPPVGFEPSFGPDTSTNYEIGFKGETADRRLSLDVAIYHIDWKDIQLATSIGGYGLNINGGGAKVDGIELTTMFRPISGMSLSANGAYTNARLSDDLPPVLGLTPAHDGDRLPFTPKFSFAVNADYNWALSANAQAFAGFSVRHLSQQTADFDATYLLVNGNHRKIQPYEVFDLHAGVDFGRFSIEAYGKNLFNSDGKTSTIGTTANGLPLYPDGAIGVGVIRPRVLGLSVTAGL